MIDRARIVRETRDGLHLGSGLRRPRAGGGLFYSQTLHLPMSTLDGQDNF